jgi:hypothetical protein
VVHENSFASLGIKDFVPKHHCHLIINLGDVHATSFGNFRRIDLPLLRLEPKVEHMLGRPGEPHPQAFAVFERLVFVSRYRHSVKSELTKGRQQHILDQRILRSAIEIRNQLLAAFEF